MRDRLGPDGRDVVDIRLPVRENIQRVAKAINRVLDAVPKKAKAAVHLCFGNYGGQSIQKGGWKSLISYLNALHVDHVVMECAHRPEEELQVFRDLDPKIGFGLGVIEPVNDIDDLAQASSPELMAHLTFIMKAAKFDLREVQRVIYNSKTYQASASATPDLGKAKYLFNGPLIRRLSAARAYASAPSRTWSRRAWSARCAATAGCSLSAP